jgi:3',5'-cyclic AMP phosphodiesterase CpdA
VRVAHLSDIHLSTFAKVGPRDFATKRVLGGINLMLNRRGYRGEAQQQKLSALRRDIEAQRADFVIITGDLTSLSLPEEFALARAFVSSLGGPERVALIPGNHDAYVKSAVAARYFEEAFAEYLPQGFPWVRSLGEHAVLVGLSSAVPTWLFHAGGKLGETQRQQAEAILGDSAHAQKMRIVAMHHPPDPARQKHKGRMRALSDAKESLALFARAGVGLILHGHEHSGLWYEIDDPSGWRCQVYDAGSATSGHKARYNLYTLSDERPALLSVEARAYDAAQNSFVSAGLPPRHPSQAARPV